MKESGWEFSHYDLPADRLTVYLWPRAGGIKFDFSFRPRFGLRARSAASLVYGYYNPEAREARASELRSLRAAARPAGRSAPLKRPRARTRR